MWSKRAQSLPAQREAEGARHGNQEGTGSPPQCPCPRMMGGGWGEVRTPVRAGLLTCSASALESGFPLGVHGVLPCGVSEHRAASALLRGQAEGQGLSPHTTIPEGPRVRRPVAGSRHIPADYSHTYKACAGTRTTRATHTVCTNVSARRSATAPGLALGRRTWTPELHRGSGVHADTPLPTRTQMHRHSSHRRAHAHVRGWTARVDTRAQAHACRQTQAGHTVTCPLGTFNL